MSASYGTVGTFTPDGLISRSTGTEISEIVTLASGQNLKRGSLLGQITTGEEFVLSLSAAVDGSETPVAVLLDDVDATAAATECLVLKKGFVADKGLILGAGHTIESVKAGLSALGLEIDNAN